MAIRPITPIFVMYVIIVGSPMLKTKFKYRAYVPLLIALGLLSLLYIFIIKFTTNLPIVYYVIITAVAGFIAWLIFFELKNKVISITIVLDNDEIKRTALLGFGTKTKYKLSEMDGYKTCSIPHEWESSEVLYLIANKKKVIRLSEYYHRNYPEMKDFLSRRLKFLGKENYNLFDLG